MDLRISYGIELDSIDKEIIKASSGWGNHFLFENESEEASKSWVEDVRRDNVQLLRSNWK